MRSCDRIQGLGVVCGSVRNDGEAPSVGESPTDPPVRWKGGGSEQACPKDKSPFGCPIIMLFDCFDRGLLLRGLSGLAPGDGKTGGGISETGL